VGDIEVGALASMESTLGYHSKSTGTLTRICNPGLGHCQVDSLTGAVASEKVTEAFKGYLSAVGNRVYRVQRHKVA
jgi:hypothetical protein